MRTLFRRNDGIYSFLLERNIVRPGRNCFVLGRGRGWGGLAVIVLGVQLLSDTLQPLDCSTPGLVAHYQEGVM